eukprot:CCRYP_014165-RF/>CCRYP_014165-RF protein AED:0.48 eAED:0.48 QI:0/-1/0/1/-1/0/1/0/59
MDPSSPSPKSSNSSPLQLPKLNLQASTTVPGKWSHSATPSKKWVGYNPNPRSKPTTPLR